MLKVIPQTENRYSVDVTSGEVTDHLTNETITPTTTSHGRIYNNLSGLSRYFPNGEVSAGMLVMLAMNDLTIPVYRWCELTVDYCNGNVLDVHYRNLYWQFVNGPIESECHPGYYYVPEYKNVIVSRTGDIRTYFGSSPFLSKAISTSWVDYLEVSVVLTNGKTRSSKVHTVVALGICHRPGDPSKLTVNHLDLDILNNHSDNLEWVSTQINTLHAYLMRNNGTGPVLMFGVPGNFTTFTNLPSLSAVTGLSPVDLWLCLRHGKDIDGKYISLVTGVSVSDATMKYITDSRVFKPGIVSLLVKHVNGGEVHAFRTMALAAQFLDTEASGIHHYLKQPKGKLYRGEYLIIREGEEWPSQEQIDAQTVGSGKKSVLVKHEETGNVTEYESAIEAIRDLGLSKKVVTVSLKRNNQRLIDGYRFQYKSDSNEPVWL